MRIAQYCFAALFLFAAAVQYNDPDPIRWIALYLLAAAVCGRAASSRSRRGVRPAAAAVGLVAAFWAAGIWAGVDHPLVPWRMFDQWEMKDVAVEETREIVGLLIVAVWMLVTALSPLNSQRPTLNSQ